MATIQTIIDAGGQIIGQACASCEIECPEGCEISRDIPAEANARCFSCGVALYEDDVPEPEDDTDDICPCGDPAGL